MPAKASSTPATLNRATLVPAFFAEVVISALASSISLRTSVETSAIALCTSTPTDGSSVGVDRPSGPGETLWATGGSSFVEGAGQRNRAPPAGPAPPGPSQGPAASLRVVGGEGPFLSPPR